ncbi:MAG: site-2 protease family protein [Phycisphaerales bacterium]|nr:site-2 protease family protein [Phycisphaerales bacterium]MCB9857012.1 site-2 protease family protein [Phycisphaerales bacterium]MCB9861861.1 site-2 protease family protein [Phycisphaerales bacterium]
MSWEDRDYASGDPTRRADGFGGLGGGGGGRFADNPLNWSPAIGHLFGIRIRVHITLLLFMVFNFLRAPGLESIVFQGVFFISILLHEFGHCFAARWVGGSAHDILMWPLGGLASVDAPRQPKPQFITVICGPLVNVAIILIATIVLKAMGGSIIGITSFPYYAVLPPFSGSGYLFFILQVAIWANSALFIFNLLPMYPMDGGRMLHCALWRPLGYYKATMVTCTIGMVIAVLVGLYALGIREYMLIAIAILGYMACYQERMMAKAGASTEDGYMGYDFSGGYSTLDKSSGKSKQPGFFAKWKSQRNQSKWRAAREREAAEQLQVDAILDKVKQQGIASLTAKEKRMLEEATRRQNEADRRHGV